MLFRISRASVWTDDVSPCDGAVRMPDGDWTIEVPTLAALMDLIAMVRADIVVGDGFEPSLVIYDDYME